jgi:competence protein ComEA
VPRPDRLILAAIGSAAVLALAAGWILLAPTSAGFAAPSSDPAGALVGGSAAPTPLSSPPERAAGDEIVVDVQGAVAEPGIRRLPATARVADAIAAAGGYAADADLEAASVAINLAQPLIDGQQLRVPRVGQAAAAASAGPSTAAAASGSASDGPVDLNTATPEELEALPGIGPVTVQKLVAARQERPFASLQDAVDRGILNRGQLEQIQGLATAG